MNTHDLIRVLKWREDVDSGEMIEYPGYTKHHMVIPHKTITQEDMDKLCRMVNHWYRCACSAKRVSNAYGEFIPAWVNGENLP